MMAKSIRIAVIGAGNMAAEHIRAFADVPGVEVAGIHSRTRAKAEALATRYSIPGVYESVGALYRGTQADLVVMAVSELALRGICGEAFRHDWICLLEKPAGHDLAEAEAIAAMAQSAGCTAFVALNRRHYSSTRAVLDDVTGVAAPRLIQVFDQQEPASRVHDRPQAVVRNWMFANSIHVVDYLRLFGRGEITSVAPILKWDAASPLFVAAKIEFSSGDVGLYTAVWNAPSPWAVTVTTQQRRWELRPLEQATVQTQGSRKVEPMAGHPWDTQFKPGLRLQAEEAMKAIKGEPHALPTLDAGLASVRLVRAIYAV